MKINNIFSMKEYAPERIEFGAGAGTTTFWGNAEAAPFHYIKTYQDAFEWHAALMTLSGSENPLFSDEELTIWQSLRKQFSIAVRTDRTTVWAPRQVVVKPYMPEDFQFEENATRRAIDWIQSESHGQLTLKRFPHAVSFEGEDAGFDIVSADVETFSMMLSTLFFLANEPTRTMPVHFIHGSGTPLARMKREPNSTTVRLTWGLNHQVHDSYEFEVPPYWKGFQPTTE